MTKEPFKDKLSEDEYKSFCTFLTVYIKPTGYKMVNLKLKNKKYNSMLSSVNTYDKDEVLKVAIERLNKPKSTPFRNNVLRKVINIIKEM
jgi:hypothetical protein